ncbi:Rho GTPase [Flagelloscypha sp. PMI_526]|nr:Rho GTPase [Flagelloscypha sp. PMI_526]
MQEVKVTLVGDTTVGKTSLLLRFTTGMFPLEYIPNSFDRYPKYVVHEGQIMNFELFNTQGHEDYNRLRPLTYHGTEIFVLCFSVIDHSSFVSIWTRWRSELNTHALRHAKKLLVGMKVDLTFDEVVCDKLRALRRAPIERECAEVLAEQIGAESYIEVSALNGQGMESLMAGLCQAWKEKGEAPVNQRMHLFHIPCTIV